MADGNMVPTNTTLGGGGIEDKLNAIEALIGISNPAKVDETTVMNFLNKISDAPRSAIKRIQRGVGTFTTRGTHLRTTITLSSVAPAKCTVTLYGGGWGSETASVANPYVISLTSTTLTVGCILNNVNINTSYDAGIFSWEVVEFY